jgi:hypothetical protein
MIMGRMAEPGLGLARSGPPPGGPDRSIRKNIVLPGYGPSGLHYGKNGYGLFSALPARLLDSAQLL